MIVIILPYDIDKKNTWNDFVRIAKNRHFFFYREYIEYHGDRFEDASLMIYDDSSKLIAILPANRVGQILYSHQGLTFGGLLMSDAMKLEVMLEIFKALQLYLKAQGILSVVYKAIPYIHHIIPAEEDRYALFMHNAALISREANATIYLDEPIKYSDGRKWSIRKAKKEGIDLEQGADFKTFWELLSSVLYEKHKVKPVHSLEEIERLALLFPRNIKLYTAKKSGELLSGAIVYENSRIAHLQYVANGALGRQVGALDLLIDHLIQSVYRSKKYFNFGISNEEKGRVLNAGLMDQKERFGARTIAYDTYEWTLA